MRFWLEPLRQALRSGEAAILVHVVGLKGSGPREVGAQTLVTKAASFGTIGGGELEYAALRRARALLDVGQADLADYPLGPVLGQCCGGAVTIAFEPFAPADMAWVEKLTTAATELTPVFRTVRIDGAGALRRDWTPGGFEPDYAVHETPGLSARGGSDGGSCRKVEITERVNPARPSLWLFGAGHVGRAVASALAPLGFALTWIDGRAGQFPDPPPPGVRTLALAMPELIVDEAPPDSVFLVMTHSHPLDEAICEAVLRRDDFAYLGLIGSATKRRRFQRRLSDLGISRAALEGLTCPIGLPGIVGKDPATIAASVAADLVIRRERTFKASSRRNTA